MSVLMGRFANFLSKVKSDVIIPQACLVGLPRLVRTAEEWCLLCVPQVLADAVSHLVVDKFSELTDNFTSPHARRKVLAGVVMTTGDFAGLFFGSCENTWLGIFSRCSWRKQKIILLCIYTFPSALQVFVVLLLHHDYTFKHFIWSKSINMHVFPKYFAWLISKVK